MYMNIDILVKKYLNEAKMSRETEEYLQRKWEGVPLETIQKVYDWFESKKNSFPFEYKDLQPQLRTFINWFNGSTKSREKFDIKNVRDIRSYSLIQIKRLWDEFNPKYPIFGTSSIEKLPVDKVFYETIGSAAPSNETIQRYVRNGADNINSSDANKLNTLITKSKELWYGTNHLIYENNGLRVYNVPNQVTSIAYGWYLYYVRYKYDYPGSNWCTTTPNANNFFSSKRHDRSFYFVIDESKKPNTPVDDDPYDSSRYEPNFYLSALQVYPNTQNNKIYSVTGVHNPGEPKYDYNNLILLYPNIKELLDSDKLKYEPLQSDELIGGNRNVDPVSRIVESEGNEYDFSIRPYNEKEEYINRGGVIREGRSWDSMTKDLKKLYSFATLTTENMFDKFSTSDLYKRLNDGEKKTLETRIKILNPNNDISIILKNIMQNDFYIDERLSLNKEYLSMYKSRATGNFGIYNVREENWVNHDGVTYDDDYKQIDQRAYRSNDGKRFFVVIYSRTSTPDNTSFYVLLPITGNKIDGYFVSSKKWEELKVQLVNDDNPEKTNTEFDPEKEDDIKENIV